MKSAYPQGPETFGRPEREFGRLAELQPSGRAGKCCLNLRLSAVPATTERGKEDTDWSGGGNRELKVSARRERRATGEVIVIRYADDTIVGFQRHADAERFLCVLRERLATIGLDLPPEKTRLIEFGHFASGSARPFGADRRRKPLKARRQSGGGD